MTQPNFTDSSSSIEMDIRYPPRVEALFEAFDEAGRDLYLVGGAVRDRARGVALDELDDFDFCTDARPEQSREILNDHGFSTYDLGAEFGTVGTVIHDGSDSPDKDCQITTYRSDEHYRRGSRHPEVQFGETIEEDLGRRDFSINSMALNGEGELFDPHGGLEDLDRGLLRVIGDPDETLAEDPLRILRVGRFMSRFDFDPTDPLRRASTDRAGHLLEISRERWLSEMDGLLLGDHPSSGLVFLEDVRALAIMLPEVHALTDLHESSPIHHKNVWEHTLEVLERTPSDRALRWAALLHDIGKTWTRRIDEGDVTFYRHEEHGAMLFEGIRDRLTFDNETADEVAFIIRHHGRTPQYTSEWSDAAVRRYVRDMDPYLESILAFARADLTTDIPEKRRRADARIDELDQRIHALRRERELRPDLPSGLGDDLMEAFDLEPSPLVGELKQHLEQRILEGTLENGRDARYYVDSLRDDPPAFLDVPRQD